MRYQVSPVGHCVAAPQPAAATDATANTLSNATSTEKFSIARFVLNFDSPAGIGKPLALSIGRALPFYRLTLNGADLTPGIDLAARDIRDTAPHLHILPAQLLRTRGNVIELQLLESATMTPVSVEQICIGSRNELTRAFRANWWRMVGVPRVCLLLYVALMLLALALWQLSGRPTVHLWYVTLLLPFVAHSLYHATSARPGGPMLWIHIGDLSLALLPYAIYGFMRAHWRFTMPGLARFLAACSAICLICIAIRAARPPPALDVLMHVSFLLFVMASGMIVAAAVLRRVASMHRVERRVVIGSVVFAFVVCLPEVANGYLPFAQRWMWTDPIATLGLALGFGYFLIRRMAVGKHVYASASQSLAGDLDEAIISESQPDRLWLNVSADIGRRERGRLLRDIHDGFGARLVGVLAQARCELPHSPLLGEIQRALLDMRLMIDALDASASKLECALARLRHRIEQANPCAAERCVWRIAGATDVVITAPTTLVAVYRCIENLLHEALENPHDGEIAVEVFTTHASIWFGVDGAATWSSTLIERIHRLVAPIHGVVDWQHAGQSPRCEISIPAI